MQTISFCSFKGGTAKTTTSLQLGACLSKYHNKKVLLVDCDSQANLSIGLGLGSDCLNALPTVLRGEKNISEVIQKTCIEGLEIVAANSQLDGIEATYPLTTDANSHERLRSALKRLEYDYCFIDTPPGLGWLTQSAFYASESSLICAIPEPYSLSGLVKLKEYHEAIQKNHPLEVFGVVLTFWDPRGATNKEYLEAVENPFPGKIFATKIRRDMAINRAIFTGKPVVETDPRSRVTKDFKSLSIEFLKRNEQSNLSEAMERLIRSPSEFEVIHE